MNILMLNKLALDLVARDFSKIDGRMPVNGGPTKTSRALAIIHLAARDAYAMVTKDYKPHLATTPTTPPGVVVSDGITAALAAGIAAAERLYPDDYAFIRDRALDFFTAANPLAIDYGTRVAHAWLDHRFKDGAELPQLDRNYSSAEGRHRPDPLDPTQETMGRDWGKVKPFVVGKVDKAAPLLPPPALGTKQYKKEYKQVYECGKSSNPIGDAELRKKAVKGIFGDTMARTNWVRHPVFTIKLLSQPQRLWRFRSKIRSTF